MLDYILSPILDIVSVVITTLGYPGIVLVMIAENVFPPIPSEAVLPFAGFLVSQGKFSILGITIAGMVGSVIGAFILYAFGYYGDELIVRRFLRRWGKWFLLSEEDLDKSLVWFKHYGRPAVFTARMVPIVRSLISIPAGLSKMPLPSFAFFTCFGTALWSFILTYAGYLLGENWGLVGGFIKKYEHFVLVLLVAVVGIFVYKKVRGTRKSDKSEKCEEGN